LEDMVFWLFTVQTSRTACEQLNDVAALVQSGVQQVSTSPLTVLAFPEPPGGIRRTPSPALSPACALCIPRQPRQTQTASHLSRLCSVIADCCNDVHSTVIAWATAHVEALTAAAGASAGGASSAHELAPSHAVDWGTALAMDATSTIVDNVGAIQEVWSDVSSTPAAVSVMSAVWTLALLWTRASSRRLWRCGARRMAKIIEGLRSGTSDRACSLSQTPSCTPRGATCQVCVKNGSWIGCTWSLTGCAVTFKAPSGSLKRAER
jgi:hypothetical protein